MSDRYLRLSAGTCEFLLPLAHVERVLAAGETGARLDDRIEWEGDAIPVTDWCARLGDEAAPGAFVLARTPSGRIMLAVARSDGIVDIPASALQPFAPVTREAAAHFDRAWPRPEGGCALRLRWPPAG